MPLPTRNDTVTQKDIEAANENLYPYAPTTFKLAQNTKCSVSKQSSPRNLSVAILVCASTSILSAALMMAETFGHEISKVEIGPTGIVKRTFEQDGISAFFSHSATKMLQNALFAAMVTSLAVIGFEGAKILCGKSNDRPYVELRSENDDKQTEITSMPRLA